VCGIAGIVSLQDRPVDPAVLQRMNDRQVHRGPDGEGFLLGWVQSGGFAHAILPHTRQWDGRAPIRVALGHRRLAILDLSDRGLQPMSAGDLRVWIVFNGEIYNHRELRTELATRGYGFTSRTDTEVLLAAYREWGEACLARLQGMFAFAIWDEIHGRLFCARDRLGIKPFYYATPPGAFTFASEMKALLAHPGVAATADDEAVLGFLIHANCDYGERTLLREVKALPPSHRLSLDVATGRIDVARYWEFVPQSLNGTPDRARLDGLRDLLVTTTRSHLVSDVRAGSCLSGGIDSSTVVSLIGTLRREQPEATAAVGDRLFTFTSCWPYRELDEREYAGAVARHVGAEPHLVFPSAADFWKTFPSMAWHQDMPFPSLSYYAQWCVMRAAQQAGVKVLLDGQGGDEVFGGYAKFRYAYFASLLRGGRLLPLAREVSAMLRQGDLYLLDLRRGYRYLPKGLRRLLGVDALLQRVLRADWDRTVEGESTPATRWWRYARASPSDQTTSSTLMQRVQVDDLFVDTLPLLLRMEDRSSMAFSLEARVPLLDHKLVEYGVSLPDHLKVRNGWSKYAIREAMRGVIPDVIRTRRTKLGFAAPDRRWLARDLRPQVTELIADALLCQRYVDQAALRRWYGSPDSARANEESYLGLFRVLALEMWMRAFEVT
jgi:asparagine synthase (glutamine-hydrolysing)